MSAKRYATIGEARDACDRRQHRETNTAGAWKVYRTPRGRFRLAYDSAKDRGDAETAEYQACAY